MSDSKSSKSKPKKRVSTTAEKKAGLANLLAFRAKCDGRPALTHGIRSHLAGTPLPEALRTSLEAWKSDLLSDLGNECTAAERALVDSACIARGVLLLGHSWMAENGVVSRTGRPAAILKVLATYMNALRLSLTTLGLERRVKLVHDLESIAVEYSQKAAAVPADAEVAP